MAVFYIIFFNPLFFTISGPALALDHVLVNSGYFLAGNVMVAFSVDGKSPAWPRNTQSDLHVGLV